MNKYHHPYMPPPHGYARPHINSPYWTDPYRTATPTSWYGMPHARHHGYPYMPIQPAQMMPLEQQPQTAATTTNSLMGSSFVKGALIGAAAAYLLSNEQVQNGAIKAAVKTWSLVQGGIEEMKERFLDAEAELHASQMDSHD